MSKPATEGHIHGLPVVIIRVRDEDKTRALREFVPLDAYKATHPPAHEYEIGALFENGDIGRRIIVRRMDRRAVFTDEELTATMGPDRAQEFLTQERRHKSRRRDAARDRIRREAAKLAAPDVCGACERVGPVVWDHRGHVCSKCNTALLMVSDSPEVLRKLIAYVERASRRVMMAG